ncbi:MAG: hypothetical protein LBL87_03485 [Ruminococcus sp.]|jgi:hypothetical protein|nr:hypothetical protein [Ruminococcus sp.]
MPLITVSVNTAAPAKALDVKTAVLILGKNRNFVKNELTSNINIFETRIFTNSGAISESGMNLTRLIIAAGDDRAKAIETAILCKKTGIEAIIITEKPIYGAENFASVIIIENAALAECIAALSSAESFRGVYSYINGFGETSTAAAAQVFSKLPENFSNMKVYTNAHKNEAIELFSLLPGKKEIISKEDESEGYSFSVFINTV